MKRTILLVSILLAVFPFSVSAQQTRAPKNYFIFTGLSTLSCTDSGTEFSFISETSADQIRVGTLVTASGGVFMDEDIFGFDDGPGNWGIYSANDRGQQTAPWPLPVDTKFTTETTLFNGSYEPLWRTVAVVNRCNGGKIKSLRSFKAKDILKNNSFEIQSIGGHPSGWTPSSKVELTGSGSFCTLREVGFCSLNIDPTDGVRQKYTQVWTGSRGKAGDKIELAAMQEATAGFDGAGAIKAVLSFANGTTTVLMIKPPIGGTSDWLYRLHSVIMPAPLTKAVVTIQHPGGVNGEWHIDTVTLAVYQSSTYFPPGRSALPVPTAP
jgi:hypothetical protein